ncbi:MAG TPA: hypothetical protein VF158_17225, partial [Longimicrobiales bacterium]
MTDTTQDLAQEAREKARPTQGEPEASGEGEVPFRGFVVWWREDGNGDYRDPKVWCYADVEEAASAARNLNRRGNLAILAVPSRPEPAALASPEPGGESRSDGAHADRERIVRERDQVIPGVFRCAKCGLVLNAVALNAQDGTTAPDTNPQRCPNGCGPMWPETYKAAYHDLMKQCEAMANELAQFRAPSGEGEAYARRSVIAMNRLISLMARAYGEEGFPGAPEFVRRAMSYAADLHLGLREWSPDVPNRAEDEILAALRSEASSSTTADPAIADALDAAQRVLDGLRHYTDPDDVTREWYEIDDLAAVDALRQALATQEPVGPSTPAALAHLDDCDDYDGEERFCFTCYNYRWIVVCPDDLCRGGNGCMHGDGEIPCPDCNP